MASKGEGCFSCNNDAAEVFVFTLLLLSACCEKLGLWRDTVMAPPLLLLVASLALIPDVERLIGFATTWVVVITCVAGGLTVVLSTTLLPVGLFEAAIETPTPCFFFIRPIDRRFFFAFPPAMVH